MSEYKRGQNPRSKANLGKPKTKASPQTFKLTQSAIDWLKQYPNKTKAIELLIHQHQQEEQRMNQLPYETINSELSVYPDLDEYERVNSVTHYDFRVVLDSNATWRVKARPYQNWKERMQADMNA